jgi:hypothetical protein
VGRWEAVAGQIPVGSPRAQSFSGRGLQIRLDTDLGAGDCYESCIRQTCAELAELVTRSSPSGLNWIC